MSVRPPSIITSSDPLVEPNRFYTVKKKEGEGAFATVYDCESPGGRRYAIKVNDMVPGTNTSAIAEARLLEELNDAPHTVKFRTSFLTRIDVDPKISGKRSTRFSNVIAIVTDLFPCKDAYDTFLNNDAPQNMSQTQVNRMAVQCLETFEYLHTRKGIAHRDVKPENLLFNPETSEALVFDFGYAKKIEEIVQDKSGTPGFLPPERVFRSSFGSRIDESTDLWALGASLFSLYTKGYFIFADAKTNWMNDYLRQMVLLFGMPSNDFIQALSPSEQHFFKKEVGDETYSMWVPPSEKAESSVNYLTAVKAWASKRYPAELPLWKVRIYIEAKQKGETPEQAEKVIRLIEPMFSYEKRLQTLLMTKPDYDAREKITATECLRIARSLSEPAESAPAVKMHVAEPEGKKD